MADIVLQDKGWGAAVALLWLLAIVLACVVALALHRRVYARMAARNTLRRKSQTLMVVAGLMIGTAILSGSLVTGDTMQYLMLRDVYTGTDLVDEWITVPGGRLFNASFYTALSSDATLQAKTDGMAPVIALDGVTVFDRAVGQTEPNINLYGIDPVPDRAFGPFVATDGSRTYGEALGPMEAVINERLARAALVGPGHTIEVYFVPLEKAGQQLLGERPPPAMRRAELTVRAVVRDEGKANYDNGKNVFVNLPTAQTLLNVTGLINRVVISNRGGVVDGAEHSQEVKGALTATLATMNVSVGVSLSQFTIATVKADAVKAAEDNSAALTDFLFMASAFTVASAVMLIVTIFVMLAEERKRELGISRAIGMRRTTLVRVMVFEGAVYSLVAAAIGAVAGLGVAYAFVWGMFSGFGTGGDVSFYFRNSSLVIGFAVGSLITMGTVAFAAHRVSKLNIVRSIKSMEEPVRQRASTRDIAIGTALLGVGALMSAAGLASGSNMLKAVGPSALLMGAGMVARRWVRPQLAYGAGGGAMFLFAMFALLSPTYLAGADMSILVVIGFLLVGGAVIVLSSNSQLIIGGVGRLFSITPRGRAVALPAIAHPLSRGMRTGMTIAMFSLVVFIVVLFSTFFSMFTPDVAKEASGYDLVSTSSVPISDIHNVTFEGGSKPGPTVNYTTLNEKVERVDSWAQLAFAGNFFVGGKEIPTYGPNYRSLIGIDKGYADHTQYTLTDRVANYTTDREVWQAVASDPLEGDLRYAIIDKSATRTMVPIAVGDEVSLPASTGARPELRYRILGIVDEQLFTGLFASKAGLTLDFPQVRGDTMFLMTLRPGEDADKVAKQLESDFSLVGMNVQVMGDLIAMLTKGMKTAFQMFDLFMALGLLVGIASLGVISARAVVERRNQIGIMRAIGYRKSMVMGAFVLEMLFVVTMGVVTGLFVGYIAGYGIWKASMEPMGVPFGVPWGDIGLILALTYVVALAATILPAYKASRTNPAEAVRWGE